MSISRFLSLTAAYWIFTPALLATDPVFHLRFDEIDAHEITNSAPGAPSTLDSTLIGGKRVPGVNRGALEFEGFGGHLTLGSESGAACLESVCNLGTGTLSIWFRFDTIPAPAGLHTLVFVGDGEGDASPHGFVIEVGHHRGDRRLFFTLYAGGRSPDLCFDTVFDLDEDRWYHFAVVIGPGFNTGYLDGVELVDRRYNFGNEYTRLFFADFENIREFYLGRGFFSGSPSFLDGAIDEFAIFDRPLDASEIQALYRSAPPPFLRGDSDGDGSRTISDAIVTLNHLFNGWNLPCASGADTNADEKLDPSDPIRFLLTEFAGGELLPEPYLVCGAVTSELPCRITRCSR